MKKKTLLLFVVALCFSHSSATGYPLAFVFLGRNVLRFGRTEKYVVQKESLKKKLQKQLCCLFERLRTSRHDVNLLLNNNQEKCKWTPSEIVFETRLGLPQKKSTSS